MTDPDPNTTDATDTPIDTFADLPIQPTGSGVADLEIAYEQMRLADATDTDTVIEVELDRDLGTMLTDAAESAAHPS